MTAIAETNQILEAPLVPETCPSCSARSAEQRVVRQLRDGAFGRVDFQCDACGVEYPEWYEPAAVD